MEFLKTWKFWKRVLIVIVSAALVLGVAGFVAVKYVLGKIGSANNGETFATVLPENEDFETDEPDFTTEPSTAPTTEPTTAPTTTPTTVPTTAPTTEPTTAPTTAPPETDPPETEPPVTWEEVEQLYDENVTNILLIGQDSRSEGSRGRADAMLVLSLNKANGTITLTSFMRDLYVQIPGGYSDNRLNASFRFGGASLLGDTIKENFGLSVDGSVEVNFTQFAQIIDILGGVEISLTSKEVNYMSDRWGYTELVEGTNLLNGDQALSYCRIRKIDSDHQRTNRQRKVLIKIAEVARSMSAGQMLDVINQVLPHVSTDLSDGQIIDLATSALSILGGGGSIKSAKVPQSGDYYSDRIRGMSVLVPDLIDCNEYLKDVIYGG